MRRLLDYCSISKNVVSKFEGEKKYVATGDIIENEIKSFEKVTFDNRPSRAKQVGKNGDVIFAKMKDTVKVLKISDENEENIYSTGFFVLSPTEKINSNYLFWLLNSKKFNYEKDKRCHGATQKALNNEGLGKILIKDIPDIEQQINISNILEKTDNIIKNRKKQINELHELVKSQFVEMFIDSTESKKWKEYQLKDVCKMNPKKTEMTLDDDDLISFIPMANVSENGEIDVSNIRKVEEVKKGFIYFAENDVLFAKITPCMENGKGAVAKGLKNKVGFGTTEFHVIRPTEVINSIWIYTLFSLKEFRKKAESNMTGSAGQKRVPISFIENYEINLPPIELQNKFASFVEQIDKQEFEIKKSLTEMENLYNSLMNEYFG